MGAPRDQNKPHPGTSPQTAYEYVKEQLELSGIDVQETGDCGVFYLGPYEWKLVDHKPGVARIENAWDIAMTYGLDYKVQLARLLKVRRSALSHEIGQCDKTLETIRDLKGLKLSGD